MTKYTTASSMFLAATLACPTVAQAQSENSATNPYLFAHSLKVHAGTSTEVAQNRMNSSELVDLDGLGRNLSRMAGANFTCAAQGDNGVRCSAPPRKVDCFETPLNPAGSCRQIGGMTIVLREPK